MNRILILLAMLVVGNVYALPPCPSSGVWHNCFGTGVAANGDKYVGEYKNHKQNGHGAGTWANGDKYVGEWKDNWVHGQGTYTYADGTKHVGEFKYGKGNGQGTYTTLNGQKYVGKFKDGKRNGQGTYTWPSGHKYVGEYKDDWRNGQGTHVYPDGGKTVGKFLNDEPFFGIYLDSSGQVSGTFSNGIWCAGCTPTQGQLAIARQIDPSLTPNPQPKPDDNKVVRASSGTGFFVSTSGHIITNHHVVEECKSVKVSFKGNEVKASVLAVDKRNDLAILKTNLTPSSVYSVSGEDAALLDDIVIAGFPLGKKISASIKTSKGSVTSLAGYGDNYSEFQTDAALNQGNSGGPIMNQKGNVVGVAVAAYGKKEGVESFNFGIKASTLKAFAQSNSLTFLPPNSRDLSNSELGKLITNATLYLECWMTVAKIKQLIAKEGNRKAFFSEFE